MRADHDLFFGKLKAGLLAISLALLSLSISFAQDNSIRQPGADKFESYLRNLTLNRLVIKHLEGEVAQELNREVRLSKAGKLANLYTDELFRAQLDSETASYWMSKVDALVRIYPALDNPRLKIATLQSRYLALERKFRQWWSARPREPREKLLPQWQSLTKDLLSFNNQMEDRYEELVAAIQATGGEVSITKELEQVEGLLLQSSFLAGWSAYFYGIVEPDGERWLQVSDSHFRDFLQIEPRTSLTELSQKWFDFNSQWHVRALVGLAMCHRGLNHPEQSEHCFSLLQQHADDEAINNLPIWKLNCRLYNQEFGAAIPILLEFNAASGVPIKNQVSFWLTVLNSSVAITE